MNELPENQSDEASTKGMKDDSKETTDSLKAVSLGEKSAKNCDIKSLPEEILVLLTEYVDYDDRVELISSCRPWFHSLMRKFIRRLTIRKWDKDLGEKIQKVIEDPFLQLTVVPLDKQNWSKIILEENLRVGGIREANLRFGLNNAEAFRVKSLRVTVDYNVQSIIESLAQVIDCESLSIEFTSSRHEDTLPYLPSVRHLSIKNVTLIQPCLLHYTSTVQYLCLYKCSISDVSMLGSIRYLELNACRNLADISSLNNNDHVVIDGCIGIQDYSQSFANTRRIKITLATYRITHSFDLTKWSKVEHLALLNCGGCNPIECTGDKLLPRSLRRCQLFGSFITFIGFTITSNHVLHELKLSNNDTISCLGNYGLEKVVLLELLYMRSLRSLRGLGRGRNRKIIIIHCDQITDFSPLNHVPIVEINNCNGFTDPLQVRCVRYLTIVSSRKMCFHSDLNDSHPYSNIYYLSLHGTGIDRFDGLERIMNLELKNAFTLMKRYLQERKKLANQKIVLRGDSLCSKEKDLLDIHNQYMKDHYDYYNNLPNKWIWVQKV